MLPHRDDHMMLSDQSKSALTIWPPHGVIHVWREPLPKRAVLRVAQVHPPQVVVVAPVATVLEEVGLVVMQPNKRCVHSAQGQAEVTDWTRVTLLHVVVFKHPVLHTWGHDGSVEGLNLYSWKSTSQCWNQWRSPLKKTILWSPGLS